MSGATNATPIVITLGAGHGLKNDDRIAIAGITGNTNANGTWSLANVTATTAVLLGSSGNGAYGGTPRVGVVFSHTPHMKQHSMNCAAWGNGVATLDIESYASLADFAAGSNNDGASAPVMAPSIGVASAGSNSTPAKSTVTLTAATSGVEFEIKPNIIMRAVLTAYTSGTVGVSITS
ncbi:hypothetical protein RD110_08035 [Rhodoferax koreense]|uniref:Uncharacterized protein n=1 Tax=Rhodoferax koreensis TaxID=1842727 RepID=A0A1P8JTT3_9BURK|nr:hypothetical protein RD110_08035 [Rhodoferax koreense]